jgi:hypothetical protein
VQLEPGGDCRLQSNSIVIIEQCSAVQCSAVQCFAVQCSAIPVQCMFGNYQPRLCMGKTAAGVSDLWRKLPCAVHGGPPLGGSAVQCTLQCSVARGVKLVISRLVTGAGCVFIPRPAPARPPQGLFWQLHPRPTIGFRESVPSPFKGPQICCWARAGDGAGPVLLVYLST